MPALEARLGDCPLRETERMGRKQLRDCHQGGVCSGFCRGTFHLPRARVEVGETGAGKLQAHPRHEAMEDRAAWTPPICISCYPVTAGGSGLPPQQLLNCYHPLSARPWGNAGERKTEVPALCCDSGHERGPREAFLERMLGQVHRISTGSPGKPPMPQRQRELHGQGPGWE